MTRIALIAALVLAPLLSAVEAWAEGRVILGAHQQKEWRGVGRLNLGDAFCTGALIAPDLVATAAHCLFVAATGAARRPARTKFVAGYRMRRHSGVQTPQSFSLHPDYKYTSQATVGLVGLDVALLRFREPFSEARTYGLGLAPRPGEMVSILSYRRDRPELPSIQPRCEVEAVRLQTAVLDCDVTFGVSGSPVFRDGPGGKEIIAIVSAMGQWRGKPRAFAALLEPGLRAILRRP